MLCYKGQTAVGSMSKEYWRYRWSISGRPTRIGCYCCTWDLSLRVWSQGKCWFLAEVAFCLSCLVL